MNEMMPVAELIGDKLPVTLWLAALGLALIILVSIPLGVLWARSGSRLLDAVLGVITQATMAVPSFFLGILVTFVFGIVLKLFAPGGYISYEEDFTGFLGYLLFPALSIALPKIAMTARFLRNSMLTEVGTDYGVLIALPKIAMTARFLRNSMLTEVGTDYVRTAYSKGCTKRRVMYAHVLRNAMMPVVTFLGMIVAEIVAGSIVIEQVFGLPGIGRLLISAISTRDFPVVQILIL